MIKISKMICGLIISSSILFASDDTAINYLQNYNNSILVKESVSKLNNLTNSIGSYIVNTGGNPSFSGNVLSLNLNKTSLKDFNNMSDEDFYKLDGSKSDVSYTLQYDSSNKIPIGINFKKSDLFGNTNFDLSNQKVIAYLNSNGIIVNPDSSLTKYFNNTTMSTIKQEYYIIKDNSNIQIIDITSPSYNNLPNDTIAYSPDGKGGFLIYQKSSSNWNVIGEPEIQLAVNSSDNLNDIKLPIGDSVTVLDEGGKAIQYTMQSSLNSDGSETSSNVWNKTTGSYEKNYYFNPIKISDISLGISTDISASLTWDSHTSYNDTYLDAIQYNAIYDTEKKPNGEDKLDINGNLIYKLDEGGQKMVIAQSLSNIIGHIDINDSSNYTYEGKSKHQVYFEVSGKEYENLVDLNWIGYSYNLMDSNLTGNGGSFCRSNIGGKGPIVSICLIFIGNNGMSGNVAYGGSSTSNTYSKISNYKGTNLSFYKTDSGFDFANKLKVEQNQIKTSYDDCIKNLNQIIANNANNYNYTYYDYSDLQNQCQAVLNQYNSYIPYVSCLDRNDCHTKTVCHDSLGQCKFINSEVIKRMLLTSSITLKLGCQEEDNSNFSKPRVTYKRNNGKMILKEPGEKIDIKIEPLSDGTHRITYLENGDSFISTEFQLEYITSTTFGDLQCIKRNAASNYGKGY